MSLPEPLQGLLRAGLFQDAVYELSLMMVRHSNPAQRAQLLLCRAQLWLALGQPGSALDDLNHARGLNLAQPRLEQIEKLALSLQEVRRALMELRACPGGAASAAAPSVAPK